MNSVVHIINEHIIIKSNRYLLIFHILRASPQSTDTQCLLIDVTSSTEAHCQQCRHDVLFFYHRTPKPRIFHFSH